MHSMFDGATVFNGDVSNWNPKSAINMHAMFRDAVAFQGIGNLNNWTVGSVHDFSSMFDGCAVFNGDVQEWDTSSVCNTCIYIYIYIYIDRKKS